MAFLEGLGISLKAVEAMVAINKALLAVPVEAMQAVVDYAARRGVTGERQRLRVRVLGLCVYGCVGGWMGGREGE